MWCTCVGCIHTASIHNASSPSIFRKPCILFMAGWLLFLPLVSTACQTCMLLLGCKDKISCCIPLIFLPLSSLYTRALRSCSSLQAKEPTLFLPFPAPYRPNISNGGSRGHLEPLGWQESLPAQSLGTMIWAGVVFLCLLVRHSCNHSQQ